MDRQIRSIIPMIEALILNKEKMILFLYYVAKEIVGMVPQSHDFSFGINSRS